MYLSALGLEDLRERNRRKKTRSATNARRTRAGQGRAVSRNRADREHRGVVCACSAPPCPPPPCPSAAMLRRNIASYRARHGVQMTPMATPLAGPAAPQRCAVRLRRLRLLSVSISSYLGSLGRITSGDLSCTHTHTATMTTADDERIAVSESRSRGRPSDQRALLCHRSAAAPHRSAAQRSAPPSSPPPLSAPLPSPLPLTRLSVLGSRSHFDWRC